MKIETKLIENKNKNKRKNREKKKQAHLITTYDSRPIPQAGKQATSLASLGRRIGRADGPDRAFPSHFARKPSNLREINPRSKFLS